MKVFTATSTSKDGIIHLTNLLKKILLGSAIIKFCGFQIGVAVDPMFALDSRSNKKGIRGIFFILHNFNSNSINTTQYVSFVNRALAIVAEKKLYIIHICHLSYNMRGVESNT